MPPSEHADWVLDLGPGGGVNGGEIVAEGTPEKVAAEPKSFTGQYLRDTLGKSPVQTEAGGLKVRKRIKGAHAEKSDLIPAK